MLFKKYLCRFCEVFSDVEHYDESTQRVLHKYIPKIQFFGYLPTQTRPAENGFKTNWTRLSFILCQIFRHHVIIFAKHAPLWQIIKCTKNLANLPFILKPPFSPKPKTQAGMTVTRSITIKKKSRTKKSWNRMNQFHEKKIIYMENIQYQTFS